VFETVVADEHCMKHKTRQLLTIAYEATVKVLTIKSNLGLDYEYMSAYIPEDTKERID
jgi:hypothetical protein